MARITRARITRFVCTGSALLIGCTLVGCAGSTHHAGDHGATRRNPSPALVSLGERRSDRRNERAYAWDTDLRAMSGDFSRTILYTSQPSRLHRATKPY